MRPPCPRDLVLPLPPIAEVHLSVNNASVRLIWDKVFRRLDGYHLKMKHVFAALVLVLLAAPAYAQDYDKGLEAYERGDHATALEAWRAAADQGDARAQNNLGGMYDAGLGVPQDDGEAAKWYRLAGEQGLVWAQLNLAHMYREGLGVPQDHGEAVLWYRMAAERGFILAQSNLGWMYLNGLGIQQDNGAAAHWYQRAAEQGDAEAQNNLGILYATGRGVPQNEVQAYVWLKLAAAQGYPEAARNRSLSAESLSPAKLSEANLLAREKQASVAGRRSEDDDLDRNLKSRNVRY